MPPSTSTRKTAAERREELLETALTEFAARGYEGGSTDAIARSAGISQPYLFRLFGTKKELFIAVVERCLADEHARFVTASEGLRGAAALSAMGQSYAQMISNDSRRLRGQMQAYAACDDPDIRDVVRRGFQRLVEHAESLGVDQDEVTAFFARGMLMNVMAALSLPDGATPWADRLLGRSRKT